MGDDGKASIVAALAQSLEAYAKAHPHPTLLGPDADSEMLAPLTAAIDNSPVYAAVAGHVMFSGGSGPVLHAESLAHRLFSAARFGDEPATAVDQLLRMLTLRETKVLFKAAIWGLALDKEIALTPTMVLKPFDTLEESFVKDRISKRSVHPYDDSVWLSQRYYDVPQACFVQELERFPYIRTGGAAFRKMHDLYHKMEHLCLLIQSATTGQPLTVACWFEQADRDLEYASWDNDYVWLLPEIEPYVKVNARADRQVLATSYSQFQKLDESQRVRLLRSMDRFRLSQCRRASIDRILDLALAFEIAVSGDQSDGAPPSWKVSMRTTQLIGGALDERQKRREACVSAWNKGSDSLSMQIG
jgi:hypothetical protein